MEKKGRNKDDFKKQVFEFMQTSENIIDVCLQG